MKKTRFLKSLSLILCAVLIAALALMATACGDNSSDGASSEAATPGGTSSEIIALMGKGEKTFFFTYADAEGRERKVQVSTDEKIVGDALVKLGLISGDEGPYGLYVKTVGGTTISAEKDGKYWAFYVNGKYAMAGVDSTEIEPGSTYSFKAEKV